MKHLPYQKLFLIYICGFIGIYLSFTFLQLPEEIPNIIQNITTTTLGFGCGSLLGNLILALRGEKL